MLLHGLSVYSRSGQLARQESIVALVHSHSTPLKVENIEEREPAAQPELDETSHVLHVQDLMISPNNPPWERLDSHRLLAS